MTWLLKDHEFLVILPQWEPNLYSAGGGDPGDLSPLVLSLPPSSVSWWHQEHSVPFSAFPSTASQVKCVHAFEAQQTNT